MSEILFRGKRKDNSEWVFGHNIILGKRKDNGERRAFIVPTGEYIDDCKTKTGRLILIMPQIEIIPETIGQCTGLKDKNGKKIFEGDIIRAITLDAGTESMAIVCFGNFIDENNGDEDIGFYIEFDGIKTTITQLAMEECKNRIEVIGNIHDNSELLKGDEK